MRLSRRRTALASYSIVSLLGCGTEPSLSPQPDASAQDSIAEVREGDAIGDTNPTSRDDGTTAHDAGPLPTRPDANVDSRVEAADSASPPSDVASDSPSGQGDAARKSSGIGIGLAGIADWSTELPFLDLVKQSRWWGPTDSDQRFDYDEDHWIRSIRAGEEVHLIFLSPGGDDIPHRWNRFVVRWKGQGKIEYVWGTKKVGTAFGGDIVEVPNGSSGTIRILEQDPTDYIRQITVVPEAHVAAYDAGAIFNPEWLERIRAFRVVRFMDWMATNGSRQTDWSGRPKPSDASFQPAGVPVEVMVRLANELGADPWFNMPHLATDDYQRQFASYVRDNLSPHLIAYVENSNEMWNWGFAQAQWGTEQAKTVLGMDGGTGWMQFSGMRAALTCDNWKKGVFAGQERRVHCVMGAFTGWRDVNEDMITCPVWTSKGNTACHLHGIDSLSVTGYFSGCLNPDEDATISTLRSWFSATDQGIGNGLKQAMNGSLYECPDTAVGNRATYEYFKSLADKYHLALTMYEGGSHITGNGHAKIQDDPDFIAFHIAVNRAAGMRDIYASNFQSWREAGGTLFMQFVDVGTPSKYGSWGAIEHLGQVSSPKWDALTQMLGQRCWWPGC